jgi:hypothetical protein
MNSDTTSAFGFLMWKYLARFVIKGSNRRLHATICSRSLRCFPGDGGNVSPRRRIIHFPKLNFKTFSL